MATVARLCARPALRVAAEEMETEAAMEADILAWWERSSGRLVRGLAERHQPPGNILENKISSDATSTVNFSGRTGNQLECNRKNSVEGFFQGLLVLEVSGTSTRAEGRLQLAKRDRDSRVFEI